MPPPLADGSATGTITDDDTVTTVPGLNSGNPGDELWGEAFYAPYVDMGLWPVPDLVAIAQGRGASLVTLGFLQATPDGKLAWAGLSALAPDSDFEQAQAINSSIAALQAAGGDVMISLGGASGTSLAQWYATRGLSARSLADAYVAVAQTYSLHRIDFDIEGSAVADAASIALRSQALALMQQDLPDLEVWYTLPVLPTGLTADGLNVVRSAVSAGVKLDGVNVMAMDYGESAAPTSGPNAKTMGAYAIQAAESTYAQLSALYGEFGQSFGWNQVGVTPMIGVNDVTTEVFTVADAQALEDFARAKGLGMLSMWSVARDTPGSLGQASPTASGLDLPAGSFSAVFNDYGTANDVGDALPTLSISDAAVVEGDGRVGREAGHAPQRRAERRVGRPAVRAVVQRRLRRVAQPLRAVQVAPEDELVHDRAARDTQAVDARQVVLGARAAHRGGQARGALRVRSVEHGRRLVRAVEVATKDDRVDARPHGVRVG